MASFSQITKQPPDPSTAASGTKRLRDPIKSAGKLSNAPKASVQTMRIVRVVCLFCVWLAVAPAQPAGRGVIAGIVVEASGDASSPEPVRKAVVTVTWHGTPRSWATTRTDGSGRFRFDGLPAGVYDLRANKPGAGVAIYGANSSRETGENITLANGETREGLKLRFIRSASVSGTVMGPDGDPASNAQVMLLRTGRNNGQPMLQSVHQAQTDDRGEYQMSGVDPGQYYAYADMTGQQSRGAEQVVTGQFYGGAHESKDSTVLSVRDGDRLRGIDFTLTAEASVRIRVQVSGVPSTPLPPDVETSGSVVHFGRSRMQPGFVQITISPVSAFPAGFFNQGGGVQGPDYRFESGLMAPGEYRVKATIQVDNKTYSAFQTVDARGGVTEVALTLAPAVELKGQVRIEGTRAASQPPMNVTLAPVGSNGVRFGMNGNENLGAQVGSDGKFTIPQVAPGRYDLNINPLPRPGFLKSVRFGDDEVRFKPIEIKPGSEAPLLIVVSMHGGKIEGQVDAGDGDSSRAGILVTPVGDLHEFARFYYSVAADDHGKFKLVGLAPGKYKIFALEKLTATSLRTPEAADQLMSFDGDYAQEIELGEDGAVEAHPKLIPLERGRAIFP